MSQPKHGLALIPNFNLVILIELKQPLENILRFGLGILTNEESHELSRGAPLAVCCKIHWACSLFISV